MSRKECAAYAEAKGDEMAAATRLPEDGVPAHLEHCVQEIDGLEDAPVQLTGPASGAPERGRLEVAGEESEQRAEEAVEVEQQAAAAAPLSMQEVNANVHLLKVNVGVHRGPELRRQGHTHARGSECSRIQMRHR